MYEQAWWLWKLVFLSWLFVFLIVTLGGCGMAYEDSRALSFGQRREAAVAAEVGRNKAAAICPLLALRVQAQCLVVTQ